MTESLAPVQLRLAAVAGWLSAAIVLVNTAKRAELLPASAATQLLAPLAQLFAIGLILGLYAASRRRGPLLTAGLVANLAAVAGLTAAEVCINLVFAYLEPAQVDHLRGGPLGAALTAASLLFILATAVYAAGLWRGGAPRIPLALYALAAVPIGLRAFVPEAALQVSLLVLAVALAWLAASLWRGPAARR